MQKNEINNSYDEKLMSEFSKLIDIIRGKLDVMDMLVISIVFPLLRRIDCIISNHTKTMAYRYSEVKNMPEDMIREELLKASQDKLFYNISGINFEILLQHPDEIDLYLNSYANGSNDEVKYILELANFATLVAKMKHSNCLYDVINFYAGIDLGKNIPGEEICKVLQNVFQQSEEHRTPEIHRLYAKEILLKNHLSKSDVSLYDPTCGIGNLLTDVLFKLNNINEHNSVKVYGQDFNNFSVIVMAVCNLLLDEDPRNIRKGELFTEDQFHDNKFDYIVADSPMGMPWKGYLDAIKRETNDDGRFWMGIPALSDSQLLFLQHVISKMNPEGSRAIFFSNSMPLSGGGLSESNIRKIILEKDYLEAVIALPKVRWIYNIQRYMWVLSNKKNENNKGLVHLIDANYLMANNKDTIKSEKALLEAVCDLYDSTEPSPYHRFLSIKDLGNYQIHIKDFKTNKTNVVEVPMTEDPTEFLKKRNLYPNESNHFVILYEKTSDFYKIDFDKYFKDKETLRSSDEIFAEVHASMMSVYSFIHEMESLEKLEENTDLVLAEDSVFSRVPSHWRGIYLSDIISFEKGKKYKECEQGDGAIPVLSIKDYRNPDSVTSSYTKDEKAVIAKTDEIVIVSDGSNSGELVYGRSGAIGPNLILAKQKSDLLHEDYLFYLLTALQLRSYAKGDIIKHLTIKDIEHIYVYLPSFEEQEKMVEYMYKIEGAIAGVEDSFGVHLPKLEEYENAIFSEIVMGKYNFQQ